MDLSVNVTVSLVQICILALRTCLRGVNAIVVATIISCIRHVRAVSGTLPWTFATKYKPLSNRSIYWLPSYTDGFLL